MVVISFQTGTTLLTTLAMAAEIFEKLSSIFSSSMTVKAEEEDEEEEEVRKLECKLQQII